MSPANAIFPTPGKWYGPSSMADRRKVRGVGETSIVLNIIAVLVAIAGAWFLFRDIHSDSRAADEDGDKLAAAQAEQRTAGDAIQAVTEGLADSTGKVSDITETSRGLAESVNNAKDSIRDCGEIIADSQQRLGECENIIRAIREGAPKD